MDYQANIFIWLSILGMVRSYILTTSFTCICMRKMSSWNLTTRQNFEFRTCVRQEVSGLTIRVQIPLVCKFYCAKNACKEHKDSRKQALAKKRTKIIVKMQGMVHFRILPQFSVLSIMQKRFIVLIPEMANFASNRMKLLVLVIEDIREVWFALVVVVVIVVVVQRGDPEIVD